MDKALMEERRIDFVYPVKTQAISVTGEECTMDCAHCGGHFLKAMKPLAGMPSSDAASFLISGGCTADGKVPVTRYAGELAAVKQGRRYNLHTGLIDADEIQAISAIADAVSFDIVGDDETIREVYGLKRTVGDYADCYRKLREKCRVIPHICIGLHGGEIRGEYRALEMLREYGADQITFIVFTPIAGTRFGYRQPPLLTEFAKVLSFARNMFCETVINLGCVRPGGRYRSEIDCAAVRLGVDSIVNPAPPAVRLAEQLGLRINRREECCSL